ncbi:hypothetical protein [Brucella gallinifaecis]|uniref:hypothetical protein n=1 Tax=Brucella gallinifaecis TaxID=215590 RepID=UPI0023612734|nr:hypothetical protein [Brucella gallinifaecis]
MANEPVSTIDIIDGRTTPPIYRQAMNSAIIGNLDPGETFQIVTSHKFFSVMRACHDR